MVAWDPCIYHIDILFCSSQIIHMKGTLIRLNQVFNISMVYGFSKEGDRKESWRSLGSLKEDVPWVILGDFNEILHMDDRIGRKALQTPSADFLQWVSNCGLEDVRFTGCRYTWTNKQDSENRIWSKIDRVLANSLWLDSFEGAETLFLEEGYFDHTPAVLRLLPRKECGKKLFKYFLMWSSHPRFLQNIQECWNERIEGTKMFQLVSKMKRLKQELCKLNRAEFAHIQRLDEVAE